MYVSVIFVLQFMLTWAWFSEEQVDESLTPDNEFHFITCSSTIKLYNVDAQSFLHSHDIVYGSGSRQQSITGYPHHPNDPNSYWTIREPHMGTPCTAGEPIQCGSTIRLQHLSTHKFLHSHLHQSPLSRNQEVSAFLQENNQGDTGDNWIVICQSKNNKYWHRDSSIRLKHQDTGKHLAAFSRHRYGGPVQGQHEVAAIASTPKKTLWKATRGVYFGLKNIQE